MDCMQLATCHCPFQRASVSIPQAVWIACNVLFLRWKPQRILVSIPQAVWIACNWKMYLRLRQKRGSFNTASGMDCMQYMIFHISLLVWVVSIPQAVWIACNSVEGRQNATPVVVSIPQAVWIACNVLNLDFLRIG